MSTSKDRKFRPTSGILEKHFFVVNIRREKYSIHYMIHKFREVYTSRMKELMFHKNSNDDNCLWKHVCDVPITQNTLLDTVTRGETNRVN